jgi:FG-GAP repeat
VTDIHARVFTLFLMEKDRLALDQPERVEMQAHLSSCPSCQADLKLYQGLCAQAGALWREPARQLEMNKVVRKVQARPRKVWQTMPVQLMVWLGLGLLALALIRWIFTELRPTPAIEPPGKPTPTISTLEPTPTSGTKDVDWAYSTPDPKKMILPEGLKAYDNFGAALAYADNLLAVGAPSTDLDTGRNAGVVYIFQHSGDEWKQVDRLIPDPVQADGRFGSTLAMNGDVLVVGAPYEYNPDSGNASGAVYLFTKGDDGWTQAIRLTAPDGQPFDLFGSALAVKEGVIAVGARAADNTNQRDAGVVYLYHEQGTDWALQARLGNNASAYEHFGHTLAFAGDDLLIGAPDADPAQAINSGLVFIYRQTDGMWSEQARLGSDENRAQARFGAALSAQGDWLAIVAPLEYQKPGPLPPYALAYENGLGAAHIYHREGDGWQWQDRIVPNRVNEEDTVRLNGIWIATNNGKTLLTINGLGNGAPYMYKLLDGSWQALPGVNLPYAINEGGIISAGGQILLSSRFFDAQLPGFDDRIQSGGVIWIFDW